MTNLTGLSEEEKKAHKKKVRDLYGLKNKDKIYASKRKYAVTNHAKLMTKKYNARKDVREKSVAAKRKWEKENPEMVSMQKIRRRIKALNSKINQGLKYHYGVTLDEYNKIFELQGGVCLICKEFKVTKRAPRLVVDHCHTTGKLRALLCHLCNCGIGYFKDNAKNVSNAVTYLEAFDGHQSGESWADRVRDILEKIPEKSSEGRCTESMEPNIINKA